MRQWLMKMSGVKSRMGQTTAEYAIIVALVAVSSIAVILIFGDQIRSLFSSEVSRIGTGQDQTVQDKSSEADTAAQGKNINQF